MADVKKSWFKLGVKATLFYDPSTQVKILPNQKVGLTVDQMQSTYFKDRFAGGHIVATEKDAEKPVVDTTPMTLEKFGTLKVAEMKKALDNGWELEADEKVEIEAMTKKDDLIAKYTELSASDEDDDEDDSE